MHCGCGRYKGHDGCRACGGGCRPASGFGQKVFDREHLRGENAIERGEAESALAADEVGEMGGAETGLAGEQGAGELTAIDAARDLNAQLLVKLREIHLWNFVLELYASG